MSKPKMSKPKMSKLSTFKPNASRVTVPSQLFVVLALALLCVAGTAVAQSSPIEQLPAGPLQEKAAAACASCHEARIIVQQRLSKAAWTKEVDKMIKWGAAVDPKDRDALIDYFSANFGLDQPAYTAPKSAVGSKSQTKTKQK
jgi:hypothetical protein